MFLINYNVLFGLAPDSNYDAMKGYLKTKENVTIFIATNGYLY